MDKAVLSHVKDLHLEHLTDEYRKVDEIPFDFMRRRMSVVVEDNKGKRQIITKGAVEEMMSVCSYTEVGGNVIPITAELRIRSREVSERLNKSGMRVLAVAQKTVVDKERDFKVSDETEMVLIGFLAFLDPPKPSASEAIEALHDNGVQVKILSGDNDEIVRTIGRQVGLDTEFSMTGMTLESLSDDQLRKLLPYYTLFSKLTPLQKTRIIRILQESGRTVGFLGDGINDASALRQADIGISVDSAVDIAKENADIILLDKDLMVLEEGVLEGRKTFGNISKYIKMTASSNFGNMLSVMVSSAFLPFLPMLPVHLLIQNLLYDISQTAIPFDRMDKEYLQKPRKWDASDLMRFMLIIGPISSLFDIITYMVLWFVFSYDSSDTQALFQSGWFVEGLLSQTLIVHMIRTRNNDYIGMNGSIALGYGRVTGADAYGSLTRGARIISLTEGAFRFDTWITTPEGREPAYYYPSGLNEYEDLSSTYLPALNQKPLKHGVAFSYHEGNFRQVADIDKVPLKKKGIMNNLSILDAPVSDHFAYKFHKLLNIAERGVYRFYMYSDDGAVLYIDGHLVIDNDGGHSKHRAEGKVALEAGLHDVRVLYFEDYMGETLEVGYSGRNLLERPLPDECLFLPD